MALRSEDNIKCQVCSTGQHREMLDQTLAVFGIRADHDLNLMSKGQSLGSLTARAMEALDLYFCHEKPDLVLVQGDTTTVFCATLAAFYHGIPIGHVEAGLRTGNLKAPWPEEANRVLTSRLVDLHFAPTEGSRKNLLAEGIDAKKIYVTGNTVIDALLWVRRRVERNVEMQEKLLHVCGVREEFVRGFLRCSPELKEQGSGRLLLVTAHRRESFGENLLNICCAIRQLVAKYPDVGVLYPVHLNPNVQEPVQRILSGDPRIQLIPPVDYAMFIYLMNKAHIVLTDSGGVQEEAPSLGKPVLVLRDTTERPEALAAGTSRLVGTQVDVIVREVSLLLEDDEEYKGRSSIINPYGDGHAAERIVRAIQSFIEN
jgi:UDP-N-acetylglucosamine 2-epimerase (non-hydrolysing)